MVKKHQIYLHRHCHCHRRFFFFVQICCLFCCRGVSGSDPSSDVRPEPPEVEIRDPLSNHSDSGSSGCTSVEDIYRQAQLLQEWSIKLFCEDFDEGFSGFKMTTRFCKLVPMVPKGSKTCWKYVVGALEAIRISCAGFPTRRMFYEFLLHFGVLSPEVLHGNYDDKVACQMILDKMGLKGHQARQRSSCELGRWLRWMRLAEVLGNAANKIQRQIHTYIARKEFISIRKAAIQLHSCWRGGKAYEEEGRYEKAMEEFNSKLNGNGELKAAESGKSHFEVHDEAEQEAFLVVKQKEFRTDLTTKGTQKLVLLWE
ncbi:unnamed protein product [Camellia sinensis]